MRALLALACLLAACARPSAGAPRADAAPRGPSERDLLVEVARLDGARDAADLAPLAAFGYPAAVRRAALLALGRADQVETVGDVLLHPQRDDTDRAAAAVDALAVAGDPTRAEEVAAVCAAASGDARRGCLRALGLLASPVAGAALEAALGDPEPATRATAAMALGVLTHRGRPVTAAAAARLAALAHDADAAVRQGTAYALFRNAKLADLTALGELTRDPDAVTRAFAVRGLAEAPGGAVPPALLDDPDVWVRVEAVRGMTGPRSDPASRKLAAESIVREWTSVADVESRLLSERVHPVLEGAAALQAHAVEPPVNAAFTALHEATEIGDSTTRARYTPELLRPIDAVNCLAAAGLVAAGAPLAELEACGDDSGKGWPRQERGALVVAAVVAEKTGREADLLRVAAAGDVLTRAAALAELAKLPPPRGPAAAQALTAALDSPDLPVAASVAEALAPSALPEVLARLAPALTGRDTERALALLDAVGAAQDKPAARAAVRPALDHPLSVVRHKAAEVMTALGENTTVYGGAQPPLAADPEKVIGRAYTLTLQTTKGPIAIALDVDLAPRHVAALVALVDKKAYDGSLFHRVVPGFVAQFGDPTGTGWGGPGYLLPSEATLAPYVAGTVGVADSGRDTGGSQLFITLTRVPHLEGRYTVVGHVVSGLPAAASLVIGDRVNNAWLEWHAAPSCL